MTSSPSTTNDAINKPEFASVLGEIPVKSNSFTWSNYNEDNKY